MRTRYANLWELAYSVWRSADRPAGVPKPPLPREAKLLKKLIAAASKEVEYHEQGSARSRERGHEDKYHGPRLVTAREKLAAFGAE